MDKPFILHLQSELSRIKNEAVQLTNCKQVFGGDINTTYLLQSITESYFVKVNAAVFADMFKKEKDGLNLLRSANTCLKIPAPLLNNTYQQQSYLLMEFVEKAPESKPFWQKLATGLAQLHQTIAINFGLSYDNYIGSVVQKNTPATTWAVFYAEQRILSLMHQAYHQQKCAKADVKQAEQFCNKLPTLIPPEPPVLLHGDLWSGNRMFTTGGVAAVYDPAVYFGNREMDIAMTLLFGGFNAYFYDVYNEVLPLQQGWHKRVDICQLYPLLVHLVLFGGQYYNSVKRVLNKYV